MSYPLAGFVDTLKATRPDDCPYCAVCPSIPCALHWPLTESPDITSASTPATALPSLQDPSPGKVGAG